MLAAISRRILMPHVIIIILHRPVGEECSSSIMKDVFLMSAGS